MRHKEEQRPLTLDEAAALLGTTTKVVSSAFKRGELKGFRIGRYFRILPESIQQKLAGSTGTSEAA
jgi:excisionase family DNA binding protein